MTWPKAALGEVLTQNSERVSVEATKTFAMAGIYSYARGLFAKHSITGGDTAYKFFHRINSHQVVLSTLKGWEGAVALADPTMAGRFLPPHNLLFDVASDLVDPAYIGWAIKQPQLWDALKGASRGMGARRETVSADDFLSFCIPVPPLPGQRRIVARLTAAAKAIETHAEGTAAVEAEIAAMLTAAFARVTAGAPRAAMGDIAPLVRRPVTIDPEASYPELGVRSFGRGTFHKPPLAGVEVGSKKLFSIEANDLLFNIVFAWEGAVAVAQSEDLGRVGSHRFLTCVPSAGRATATFLRYWFLSAEGLLALGRASPGGAGRNRTLGIKALQRIEVPVPPLNEQQWFDRLQAKAQAALKAQADATVELAALIPAMLDEALGMRASK